MSHGGIIPEKRDGVSIQGLWESHTESIIDTRFGDAYMDTWKTEGMDNIFTWWEKLKKDKREKNFHDQQIFFSLFVL